jgi:ribose-phosphate pyrophosphokinase
MTRNEQLARDLASLTAGELGDIELRKFPDGESYVRILSDVKHRDVFLVCTLARPDAKVLQLVFTAETARSLGAASVKLIAPYLGYMRQDRIFHPGEALTSRTFAELIGRYFDALVTVDPHLHRHATLDELYDIPSTVLHAAPLLAQWIETHVDNPLIIGPDIESSQWVEHIALDAGAPWIAFRKSRRGDRKVRMTAPDLRKYMGCTPVIVDDIVSSGVTIRQALRLLRDQQFHSAYCLAVHALCTAATARRISDGSRGFFTSNTVASPDARFDVAPIIADALIAEAARCSSRTDKPKGSQCSH